MKDYDEILNVLVLFVLPVLGIIAVIISSDKPEKPIDNRRIMECVDEKRHNENLDYETALNECLDKLRGHTP